MLAALQPVQALALECNDNSIRSAYWFYKVQADTYQLALGEFSNLRKVDEQEPIMDDDGLTDGFEIWEGTFSGFTASRGAIDKPFEARVTLELPDNAFIGGALPSSSQLNSLQDAMGLVWLRETEAGYRLIGELCMPLIDTNPASIKPTLRCLNGGYCPKF